METTFCEFDGFDAVEQWPINLDGCSSLLQDAVGGHGLVDGGRRKSHGCRWVFLAVPKSPCSIYLLAASQKPELAHAPLLPTIFCDAHNEHFVRVL